MLKKFKGLMTELNDDSTYSSSKFWFNITNTVIVVIYFMIGLSVSKSPTPNIEGFAWLTLVMAGVVTANKFANKFLVYKYSTPPTKDESAPEEESEETTEDKSKVKQSTKKLIKKPGEDI